MNDMDRKRPVKIATIGGGGGHAQILRGLRALPGIEITAICPSTDSGGSTGRLAGEYRTLGFLGDLTKCISALCPDKRLARALMYRFERGMLAGHSIKNILFLGLEKTGGVPAALELMYRIAGIAPHRVLPVTMKPTELRARLKLGNEIRGETNIDLIAKNPLWHPDTHAIREIFLKPRVNASREVISALNSARICVICPGDLYSSVLPVLLPRGVAQAIKKSTARIVVVLNIMTKKGETQGYGAGDFLERIERHLGRPCDTILYNTAPIPRRAVLAYAMEHKVKLDSDALRRDRRVIAAPLLKIMPGGGIYHDERAIARILGVLLKEV